MLMEGRDLRRSLIPTSCNSWRCVACRDRNMRRFKAVVSHGVSTLGPCMFITITYRKGSERLRAAGCVARDWRAFWRLAHRDYPQTKKWGILRVMELTKKGTPHFHLIVGPVSERMRCYGKTISREWFKAARREGCECWSHRLSRLWERVQAGESYIVHVIPVVSGRGAGAYMGKYLGKEFDADRLVQLGMKRRFSVNGKWPREPRSRLIAPGTDGWRRTTWAAGLVNTADFVGLCEFDRVRTLKQEKRDSKAAAARLLRMIERRNDGNQTSSA